MARKVLIYLVIFSIFTPLSALSQSKQEKMLPTEVYPIIAKEVKDRLAKLPTEKQSELMDSIIEEVVAGFLPRIQTEGISFDEQFILARLLENTDRGMELLRELMDADFGRAPYAALYYFYGKSKRGASLEEMRTLQAEIERKLPELKKPDVARAIYAIKMVVFDKLISEGKLEEALEYANSESEKLTWDSSPLAWEYVAPWFVTVYEAMGDREK